MSTRGRHFMGVFTDPEKVEKLKEIKELKYCIGQWEIGDQGTKHFQCAFGFNITKRVSTVINLIQEERIEHTRDVDKAIKYCTKEEGRIGDIISWGEIPRKKKDDSNELLSQAVKMGTVDDALECVKEKDAYFYMMHKKQLVNYFTEELWKGDEALYKPEDFNIPLKKDFSKTLVFIGPTGIGKTQYALAHFKEPLHVRDKVDYARYTTRTDGIVMDDINTAGWNALTFLKLIEIETAVSQDIKYGSIRIEANTPRIICCNSEELLWPKDMAPETKAACMRRLKIYHLNEKLYGERTNPVHRWVNEVERVAEQKRKFDQKVEEFEAKKKRVEQQEYESEREASILSYEERTEEENDIEQECNSNDTFIE